MQGNTRYFHVHPTVNNTPQYAKLFNLQPNLKRGM
jgi:hypothetical protein